VADRVVQGCKAGLLVGLQMAIRWICCGEIGQAADGSDSYMAEVGPAS